MPSFAYVRKYSRLDRKRYDYSFEDLCTYACTRYLVQPTYRALRSYPCVADLGVKLSRAVGHTLLLAPAWGALEAMSDASGVWAGMCLARNVLEEMVNVQTPESLLERKLTRG